eukprot:TRINITY_DN12870_c0_g3_i1.p1 TRINITY_DN12870_c0_g3~~TRINITY_DN12870_c0_g3_i1.p1  ORF type:complete len:569 (+),score=97.82 TRINITY_DN12870_c0_g3_i1:154-1860(+)
MPTPTMNRNSEPPPPFDEALSLLVAAHSSETARLQAELDGLRKDTADDEAKQIQSVSLQDGQEEVTREHSKVDFVEDYPSLRGSMWSNWERRCSTRKSEQAYKKSSSFLDSLREVFSTETGSRLRFELDSIRNEMSVAVRARNRGSDMGRKGRSLVGVQVTEMKTLSMLGGTTLRSLPKHPLFDTVCATIILLSTPLVGVETHLLSQDASQEKNFDIMNSCLFTIFATELFLRLWSYRWNFFTDAELRFWNIFDLLLVLGNVTELIIQSLGLVSFRGLKTMRVMRVLRIFRLFRFFRTLTEMASMIFSSLRSLCVALILLSLFLYVFAIMLTTEASELLQSRSDMSQPNWHELLSQHEDHRIRVLHTSFGGLFRTLYTLYSSILGGKSWGEVLDPIIELDVITLPVMFLVYIAFTMLAMLNIITGVFVDNAFHYAQSQRNIAILREIDRKEEYIALLRDFFSVIDDDGSGEISLEEFDEILKDPTLSAYFRVLGFDLDDAGRFLSIMDLDGSETIQLEEFIYGCQRFKGAAQGVDMAATLKECMQINRKLDRLVDGRTSSCARPRALP